MDIDRRAKKRYTGLSRLFTGMVLILCSVLLVRSYHPTMLGRVMETGQLHVISRNGPTTYYEGPEGLTGFEYTLLKGFAEELGVELGITNEDEMGNILSHINRGTHHLAAAAITVTPRRSNKVMFSQPFIEVQPQLVYHTQRAVPAAPIDLMGLDIVVLAQSSHVEHLREMRETYPELSWRELQGMEMIDLLEMVQRGEADAAIVDSNAYDLHRYAYPRVQVAFDISDSQYLAWAFPPSSDTSLYDAAQAYLSRIRSDGTLEQITHNFFEPMPIEEVAAIDALMFTQRLEQRLPLWEEHLRLAAEEYELEWELLASISYQESHWDPAAVSYTGVRGLM